MFPKLLFLVTALFSAVIDFTNPIPANAQNSNNNGCQASRNRPPRCQSVPTPAMLPALILLGGGMMLYNRRKKEN